MEDVAPSFTVGNKDHKGALTLHFFPLARQESLNTMNSVDGRSSDVNWSTVLVVVLSSLMNFDKFLKWPAGIGRNVEDLF